MLNASSRVIKYVLFVFNLVFVITGITLLSLGLIIKGVYHEYETFLDDRYFSAPTLLITVGTFIFLIAFFGCCGAVEENHCMIITFSLMMTVIFIMELAAGVTGYMLSDETTEVLTSKLSDSMKQYNKSIEITKIWDEMQADLQCCGTHGYADWAKILNDSLPMSCCGPQIGAIGNESCLITSKTLFKTSCLTALGHIIEENASTIGFAGISIAFVQVLGVVLSCALAKSIRHNYESV